MSSTATVFLILNGKGAGSPEVREAVLEARRQGHDMVVRVTWEGGDAARYVNEAVQCRAAIVVAGGGDGTVNEVASALLAVPAAARPALGVLPLGTANDFAHGAGIPLEPAAALALILKGRAAAVDAVMVNDRAFLNMATGGFGTQVTVETPPEQKARLGGFAYLLTGLVRLGSARAERVSVTAPGFHWKGHFLVLALGNGCQAGGGQRLCPEARLDSGMVELRILAGEALLPAVIDSLREGNEAESLVSARLPRLTLEAPEAFCLNLDGEPLTDTRFEIEVLPGALRCFLPEDCPLLGAAAAV